MKGSREEDQQQDHPSQLQPGRGCGRGGQGRDPEKTTQRGTPRLTHDERSKINRRNAIRHGLSNHDLYWFWQGMRRRVRRSKTYLEFGIDVDPRWDDLATFIEDIESTIGPLPAKGEGWSLDREDNDRGYWHWNVRWAKPDTQANNRGHRPRVCLLLDGDRAHAFSCFTRMCAVCPWPQWSSERKSPPE